MYVYKLVKKKFGTFSLVDHDLCCNLTIPSEFGIIGQLVPTCKDPTFVG